MNIIEKCKDVLIEHEEIIFAYIFGSYVQGKMREDSDIDIAIHIVVDNNIGNPETFWEAFDILNKEKYLSDDEAKTYRNMVGLRNILSHEYLKIDKKIIYDVLQNKLIDIKKFVIFVHDNFL